MDKQELITIMSAYIEKIRVETIIDFLSINNCLSADQEATIRKLELRCIYEQEQKICFGLNTIIKSLILVKGISICGHFPQVLGIDEEKNNAFKVAQSEMTQFFSYHIGDLLEYYGYILPLKSDGTIKVDIKRIVLPQETLVFNDIDVLAVDKINRVLYNCELKYYRARVDYRLILTDGLDDKKFGNLMKRNKLLIDNLSEILKNEFGIDDSQNYKVVPIVITSRVNNNRKHIKEYTYQEFKHALETHAILYK